MSVVSDNDQCVTLSGLCDVRVRTERVAHTSHLYVEPISRAEISAKEVRSRIKGQEKVKVITESVKSVVLEESVRVDPPANKVEVVGRKAQEKEEEKETLVELSAVFKQVSLVVVAEQPTTAHSFLFRESLRATFDHLVVLLFPHPKNVAQLTAQRKHTKYGLAVAATSAQIDNQTHQALNFDFPVVLFDPKREQAPALDRSFFSWLLAERIDFAKKRTLFCLDMTFARDPGTSVALEEVACRIAPLQLFIEDTFVWGLLQIFDKLLPVTQRGDEKGDASHLSDDVKFQLQRFSRPIRLQRLVVEPASLDLSVHASLKIFLAADHSPLSFSRFDQNLVFASASQLAHTVAMHYASDAMFRAGVCQLRLNSPKMIGVDTVT